MTSDPAAAAKELRLVSETNLGAGDNLFEWLGTERHHHLICRACGQVSNLDQHHLDVEPLLVSGHLRQPGPQVRALGERLASERDDLGRDGSRPDRRQQPSAVHHLLIALRHLTRPAADQPSVGREPAVPAMPETAPRTLDRDDRIQRSVQAWQRRTYLPHLCTCRSG